MTIPDMVFNTVLLIAILIVGYVLYHQIKAQQGIINSLKTYFEIFDIDKIKALDKFRHETTMMKAKAYITTEIKKEIQPALQWAADELRRDVENRYDEVCSVLFDVIMTLEPDERQRFVEDNLPYNRREFLDAIREEENSNTSSSQQTGKE